MLEPISDNTKNEDSESRYQRELKPYGNRFFRPRQELEIKPKRIKTEQIVMGERYGLPVFECGWKETNDEDTRIFKMIIRGSEGQEVFRVEGDKVYINGNQQ